MLIVTTLNAKEDKLTNFVIKGSIFANPTLYQSNFSQLPGFENCCTSYQSAFGINPMFSAGFEYIFSNKLFDMPYRYSFELGFTGLSADYSVEEFIGHNINEDSYNKIYSEYILESDLSYITSSHLIKFFPYGDRLSFGIGFIVGYPMDYEFYQVERLKEPSGITFENGDTKRKEFSGELPDVFIPYFAGNINFNYEFYKSGPLSAAADVRLAYALTDVINSVDWKAHSLQAGISLLYRFQEPKPPVFPPAIPPMPDLKMPASVEKFDIHLAVYDSEDNKININDTIHVKLMNIHYHISYNSIPAVVLFEKNSTKPINEIDDIYLQDYKLKEFANSQDRIDINLYSTDDEEPSTIEKRKDYIHELLGKENVNIKSEIIQTDNLPHQELAAEMRKFEITGKETIDYKTIDQNADLFSPKKGRINISSVNSQKIDNIDGIMKSSSKELKFSSDNFEFDLTDLLIDSTKLGKTKDILISVNALNNNGLEAKAERRIFVNPIIRVDTIISGNKEIDDKFILCYFDFNSSKIKNFDNRALEYIRSEAANGKEVLIYGYTDDLGEEEYNNKLAQRRAESARDLIGKQYKTKIIIDDSYPFANQLPYGRIKNRVVLVRIQ